MKNTSKLFEISNGVDAIVVVSEKNRMYFTGFASTFGYLILLPQNKNVFVTDPRYYEMAEVLVKDGIDVQLLSPGQNVYALVDKVLAQNNVKKLGYEDTEVTVADFNALTKGLPNYQFVAVGEKINVVRSVKDQTEIAYVKKAQEITDKAFSGICKVIKAGMTEKQVAVELEYLMAKNGAEGLAFDTIIASGVNSSKPHAHPTDKVIENGDAVTMDFGARYHGYCADMTRTVFVGQPSDEMIKIYNIVLEAQQNGIKNAHPGMTGKEYDAYARDVITKHGYGEYFTHSMGHSLGIDIHEMPYGNMRSTEVFEPNQFITAEPGIYLAGKGGVRIEDLLLITQDGVIDLTTSKKDIIIL